MCAEFTVGIRMQASATVAVYPPSRPTTPMILVPIDFAYFTAATRFGLTFFSIFPPPTEKTIRRSFDRRRLVRNQLSKIELQPSSLAPAVSSETLSVGA